jgi:hypothetical protein
MSGMMKRKCCGGCGGLGNCTEWCDCLPDDIHLSIEIYQRKGLFIGTRGNKILL